MLALINKIAECSVKPWRNIDKRDLGLVDLVLIHRNAVARTPEEMMYFFTHKDKTTGGRFPYGFFIDKAGLCYQCAPLSVATPGAGSANRRSVQIVLDGDFRKERPTAQQWDTLSELCTELSRWKPGIPIEGHTDQPGRSADPKKVCPGDRLSLPALRLEVNARLHIKQREGLRALGVTGL